MIIMASSSTLQNIPLHALRPAEHLLAHLVNEVRPDGRQPRQPRPIAVLPVPWQKQSNVLASKHVQLGGSVALGVVKLSIGTPAIQRPNVGDIEFKVAMNHLLPSSMQNQRRNDESLTSTGNSSSFVGDLTPSTQEVEYMLHNVFNMGEIVDLTKLCIVPESAAMRLTVHITVLSYAGNLRDLCFLCGMLALREVQLPSVIPRPSESELKKLNSKEAQFWRAHSNAYAVNYDVIQPLREHVRLTLPVTCAYITDRRSIVTVLELLNHSTQAPVSDSCHWFLDPTYEEESIAEGIVTFLVDPITRDVVYSSSNTQGIQRASLMQMWTLAEEHAQNMFSALQL
jgi:exosome complex RNA-binding protein Rrp42 (RNase PH superfamily)